MALTLETTEFGLWKASKSERVSRVVSPLVSASADCRRCRLSLLALAAVSPVIMQNILVKNELECSGKEGAECQGVGGVR